MFIPGDHKLFPAPVTFHFLFDRFQFLRQLQTQFFFMFCITAIPGPVNFHLVIIPKTLFCFLIIFMSCSKLFLQAAQYPFAKSTLAGIPSQNNIFLSGHKNKRNALVFQKPCFGMKSRISLYLLVKRD